MDKKEKFKKNVAAMDYDKKDHPEKYWTAKYLRKRAITILVINIIIFVLLCVVVFGVIIAPIIGWIYGLNNTQTWQQYIIDVMWIGVPALVVTALYGGLLFWVLLVKFVHFEHKGHRVDLDLGVKSIVLCVDEKVIAYVSHGFYSCPSAVWHTKIGDEHLKFEIFKKNSYKIEINCVPVSVQKIQLESQNKLVYGNKK